MINSPKFWLRVPFSCLPMQGLVLNAALSVVSECPMDSYRTTSARAVIRNGDNVLVEWLASKNFAFLPGGTVEANEKLDAALQRELAEELDGAEFTISRYLGEIGHRWKTASGIDSCLNHFFEVAAFGSEKLQAKEMGREIRWLPVTTSGLALLKPPILRDLLLKDLGSLPWKVVDSEVDEGN